MTALNFDEMMATVRKERQRERAEKERQKIKETKEKRGEEEKRGFDGRVECLGEGIFLVEDFLSEEEERKLVEDVYRDTESDWKVLAKRRMKNIGGIPHAEGMVPELPLPKWLENVVERVATVKGDAIQLPLLPNQCLLNEYRDGRGISRHKDGPNYLSYAFVLSLLSESVIFFSERRVSDDDDGAVTYDDVSNVWLPRRSLLYFCGDAYDRLYHHINTTVTDVIDEKNLNIRAGTTSSRRIAPGDSIRRDPIRLSLTLRHAREIDPTLIIANDEFASELRRRSSMWFASIDEKKMDY